MLGFIPSGLALQPSIKNFYEGHSTLRNMIIPLETCLIIMICDTGIFSLAGCDSNARLIPSGL